MMKNFILLILTIFLSYTLDAQISKPLNPPSATKDTKRVMLKPIRGAIKGIPNARTNVIRSFVPPTLPMLQRNMGHSGLKIVEQSATGRPIMIKGRLPKVASGRSMLSQAYDYLEAIKSPIEILEPQEEFELIQQSTDHLAQTHFKLQQTYKGIPVFGGQVWLHEKDGGIHLFNGRNYRTPNLKSTTPTITAQQAQNIANESVKSYTTFSKPTGLAKKLSAPDHAPELVVYHDEKTRKAHLAWHLRFHPNLINEWEYFVDAHDGTILESYKTTCQLHYHHKEADDEKDIAPKNETIVTPYNEANLAKTNTFEQPQNGPATAVERDLNNMNRTLHSYEVGGNFFLINATKPMFNAARSNLPSDPIGALWTIDGQNGSPTTDDFEVIHVANSTNNWNNPTAVSAHHNAGVSYDYFRNTFGRNSINGSGGTVVSIINVADEDGSGLDNAFWSGSAMFYGNGNQQFEPLAKALDVAAHEMTHGVIQNTANLRYQGESGAMNESFADIFAVLIDRDDYQLGEDVVNRNFFRSGALRDLANPNNGGTRLGDPGWQPDNVSQQFRGQEDNGGVHINSGITNRAFFLIASRIGRQKAENIYYRALTNYLVNTSQFVDLRASILQSATDFHGANSNEVAIVANSFDQVGIFGSNTGEGENSGGAEEIEVETNPGNDFILYTNDNKSNLSVADGQGEVIVSPFTNTGILSRPSITDDGSAIVFVADDKTIHLITIDSDGQAFEEVIQDQPIWRNVAVSRDGFRIAALEDEISNKIEVFDFTLERWKTFELYNPTFTEGISTGEVQFADVIEFDFSSQFVMYDAKNQIRGNFGGSDIEFWDIGFVQVYDNEIDNFEQDVNNNIFKLFSGLAENVSIGNPTFSKNSPNIIAFDYIDSFEDRLEMRGMNLSTNDQTVIFRNGVLSVPNFSRLDDKIIFNARTTQGNNVVAQIGIGSDKITAAGDASVLVADVNQGAQLGVWFSDGERTLTSTNELSLALNNLQVAPNPFAQQLTVSFNVEEREDLQITLQNALGQVAWRQVVSAQNGDNNFVIPTATLANGTYILSLTSEKGVVSRKVVK
ncbi:MAG: M4 family metallopeptidase [Bacteroidota bacterium]